MALNRSHVRTRLQKARDYLAQPGQWHCGELFHKKDGKLVGACAIGAIIAVDPACTGTGDFERFNVHLYREARKALDTAAVEAHGYSAIHVNDGIAANANRDKRYVLRVYDRAIRNLTTAA